MARTFTRRVAYNGGMSEEQLPSGIWRFRPVQEPVVIGHSPSTEPHWKEVPDPHGVGYFAHFEEPGGWYAATVKPDGCVDLRRYYNLPLHEPGRDADDEDYLHICDIDDLISRLQALRDAAKAKYGADWGRC